MRVRRVWDTLTLGPARRRRWMHRRLADLDRVDWETSEPSPTRRRRRLLLPAAVVAVTVGLGLHQVSLLPCFGHGQGTHGLEALSHDPLGKPAPAPSGEGGYRFTTSHLGVPVAYDPCRPVHIVVNHATAPPGADLLLQEAISRVSRATGLVFLIDGPTDERPSSYRQLPGGLHLGRNWPPVLVSWTTPAAIPELAGPVAGLGGSTARTDSMGLTRYVTGAVNLDGPDIAEILRRPNGWPQARAILMHELGHLVGLAHIDDPHQLMSPQSTGQTRFGDGDLRGLHKLGSGRCSLVA